MARQSLVIAVVLSGTALVAGKALSEPTTTPVARLKVGTVVTGQDIPSATITKISEDSFSFQVAGTNGRPPITVVINGNAAHPDFSVADGWAAINKALTYGIQTRCLGCDYR
jgi:hypothetical protein